MERRELLNAAPVFEEGVMFMLNPMNEDVPEAANSGTLVADLIQFQVSDPDGDTPLGIAITAIDTTSGTWQYTLNGTDWSSLSPPAADSAFLLGGDDTTAIRFLPDADYNGFLDEAITFHVWDGSTGVAGTTADVSITGGETAFSSDTAAAMLFVDPMNDAPAFQDDATFALNTIDENVVEADNPGTLILDLVATGVTDPDQFDLLGVAITATNTQHGAWQYTLDGVDWSELTAPAAGSAFLLDGDGLTAIRFLPDPGYHGTIDPAVTFYAWDESTGTSGTMADVSSVGGETAFSSTTATASLTVTGATNEAPVLVGIEETALPYAEGDPATAITGTMSVADADSADLSGATVTITTNYRNGEDVLSFTNAGTITGDWDADTGTLTLTGIASLADYQAALRAVLYENASDTPDFSTRTVTFRVNDGSADSNELSRDVVVTAVNDAPVLAGIEGTSLSYGAGSGTTAITSTIAITDPDSVELSSASVQITTNYRVGEDVLSFSDTGSITGTWNATTGTLTLTGVASLADYQTALRAVMYENTSDTPSALVRAVTFLVNDGIDESNSSTRSITINEAPVLAGMESTALAYTENDAATAITGTIITSDSDGAILAGARVQITGNYQSDQDVLSFASTSAITGTWNATTGTLTLTGSDSLANYQAALRAVKYVNSSDAPNTLSRTVAFAVNDGAADSNSLTRVITVAAVNDASLLAGIESTALAYAENDAGKAVTSTIVASDVDSANLTGATVQIIGNYQSDQDVLSFSDTGTISGTWNAGTGTLTLTGVALLADYQAALRAVKYANVSDNPSTLTRTLTFKVWDGAADSNVLTRSVTVTAVNDAPVLDAAKGPMLTAEAEDSGAPSGAVGTLVSSLVDFALPAGEVDNVSDADSGALLGIAMNAADTTSGTWFYSTNGGTDWYALGSVSNSNARLLAADANTRIYFQPNANYYGTLASAMTFRAWDRTSGVNGSLIDTTANGGSTAFSTATDAASLTITPVNDVPTLSPIANPAAIHEGAWLQTVNLSGISAGTGETQVLEVTATSGNTALIPDPAVTYTSPATTGSLSYQPVAGQSGTAVITVTVRDAGLDGVLGNDDDATFQRTFTVTVNPATLPSNTAYLAPDPLAPDRTVLYVYGTTNNDSLVLKPGTRKGDVSVSINNRSKGAFHPTSRIVVHGLEGNDQIKVKDGVSVPAWLYGDEGNDQLWGGKGLSLLLGGAGNDQLWAGKGRSFLVGGSGRDQLWGGKGDTILIGGTTDHDANDQALMALLDEWNSSSNYATRVSHVTGMLGGKNGSYFLNETTVHGDAARDMLSGGSASDLYFQDRGDRLQGKRRNESVISIREG